MISIKEAQELMKQYIALKNNYKVSNNFQDLQKFKSHEKLCLKKFNYIIFNRIKKYRRFPNYEDLYQDAFVGLVSAMNTYNPSKGNFFWWAHKHINTKVSRSANKFSTIRVPLNVEKPNKPKKVSFPILTASKITEDKRVSSAIEFATAELNEKQNKLITLAFGLDKTEPLAINKICKEMKLSRRQYDLLMNRVLDILKKNIKL
jgi:RNA polymerase sigma factor (sigma-70 family)